MTQPSHDTGPFGHCPWPFAEQASEEQRTAQEQRQRRLLAGPGELRLGEGTGTCASEAKRPLQVRRRRCSATADGCGPATGPARRARRCGSPSPGCSRMSSAWPTRWATARGGFIARNPHRPRRGRSDGKGGEGGRPPRNRGGGSGAAVRTGTSRAPGGLGRATVRSVRRSRASGSGCVREGTTRSKLGRPRPDVTHSPLWAGCISHLGRTYDRGGAQDRPWGRMSSTSHTFFTRSAARRPGSGTGAAHLPGHRLRCARRRLRRGRTPAR